MDTLKSSDSTQNARIILERRIIHVNRVAPRFQENRKYDIRKVLPVKRKRTLSDCSIPSKRSKQPAFNLDKKRKSDIISTMPSKIQLIQMEDGSLRVNKVTKLQKMQHAALRKKSMGPATLNQAFDVQRVYTQKIKKSQPFWSPQKRRVDDVLDEVMISYNKHTESYQSFSEERLMPLRNLDSSMNFTTSSHSDFGQEAWLGMAKSIKVPFLSKRMKQEASIESGGGGGGSSSSAHDLDDIGSDANQTTLTSSGTGFRQLHPAPYPSQKPIHPWMLAPYRLPPKQTLFVQMVHPVAEQRNLGVARDVFHIPKNSYETLLGNELLGEESEERINETRVSTTRQSSKLTMSPRKRMLNYGGNRDAAGSCDEDEGVGVGGKFGLSNSSKRYLRSPSNKYAPLRRSIPMTPYKVLDAPDLVDDFYLNLVDWSASNILAVGLSQRVYLWNATTSVVTRLCEVENDQITSISWSKFGDGDRLLAIGTRNGVVQVWDALRQKRIAVYTSSQMQVTTPQRVGVLAWNDWLICSGSRDRTVVIRDFRCAESDNERSSRSKNKTDNVALLPGHVQEVCGMKWSLNKDLLATGGNDNRVIVRSIRNLKEPVYNFDGHVAAVKALDWSPHQPYLLCSGGGTADRTIRFWNILTGELVHYIDTGSQVCNIAWSKFSNEFVTTHGYSRNHIIVWRYPSLHQLTKLNGHTYRVLYMSKSPDGRSIVTGAGDETLRFWNVFAEQSKLENPYKNQIQTPFGSSQRVNGTSLPHRPEETNYEAFHQNSSPHHVVHPRLSNFRDSSASENANPHANQVFPTIR